MQALRAGLTIDCWYTLIHAHHQMANKSLQIIRSKLIHVMVIVMKPFVMHPLSVSNNQGAQHVKGVLWYT